MCLAIDSSLLTAFVPFMTTYLAEGAWGVWVCRQSLVLEVAVGKFLDTSLIRADVQPRVARLLIKGRLLQLVLPAEVRSSRVDLEHSAAAVDAAGPAAAIPEQMQHGWPPTPLP